MDEKTQQQIIQLVQAAMQGNQQANQQIQQIAQAAQQGDQQAIQLFQIIQKVAQQLQGTKQAKHGTKLEYIRSLKSICNEDEELVYMKKGGKVCPVCQKKKVQKEKCGGAVSQFKSKRKKMQTGGQVPKQKPKTTKPQPKTLPNNNPKKPTTPQKASGQMPNSYNEKKHKDLIRRFQQNGRTLPKASMDSLQWYNRNNPNQEEF